MRLDSGIIVPASPGAEFDPKDLEAFTKKLVRGMYHLARSRTELKTIKELKGIVDPGPVRVAVLPCADLNPKQ